MFAIILHTRTNVDDGYISNVEYLWNIHSIPSILFRTWNNELGLLYRSNLSTISVFLFRLSMSIASVIFSFCRLRVCLWFFVRSYRLSYWLLRCFFNLYRIKGKIRIIQTYIDPFLWCSDEIGRKGGASTIWLWSGIKAGICQWGCSCSYKMIHTQ